MNVRILYVALTVALLAVSSACTDAERCERGMKDCACLDDAPACRTGLSCEDGVCVEGGGGGASGTSGSGGSGGTGPRDAGAPPDVDCDARTVAGACLAFCEAFCENQERFCYESACTPDDCRPGGQVVDICTSRCSNASDMDDRIACAKSLCEDQIDEDLACDDFGVEVASPRTYETLCFDLDPTCVQKAEIGCSNVCGTANKVGGDLSKNGICEDGHEPDSVSGACSRGTDCEDCGAHPCAAAGKACVNHGDCCGFYGPGALCVDPDGPSGEEDPFCLPTCDADNPCPTGFRCSPTTGASDVCVPR